MEGLFQAKAASLNWTHPYNDGVLKVVGIIIKANLDYFLPT